MSENPRCLDIGCGSVLRGPAGWELYGLDIVPQNNPNIKQCDLVWESIPYEDNYFDRIEMHDLVEHLPQLVYMPELELQYDYITNDDIRSISGVYIKRMAPRNPLIELFNECYRVLRHDGILFVSVPKFPGWGSLADPSHLNFWIPDRINYFSGDYFGHRDYGHTSRFEKLWCEDWNNGVHMRFELRAIKSVPNDYPYKLQY